MKSDQTNGASMSTGSARRKPRRKQLNGHATYVEGTGCIQFADGAVVELTVAEEELFELLLGTPKVTVPWPRVEYETARTNDTIRTVMRGLRNKLGARAIRTHVGKGISLQPQFVGSARFALVRRQFPALVGQASTAALVRDLA